MDINQLRQDLRKSLVTEGERLAIRNGSTCKSSVQDYAYHAGIAQGLTKAADLVDDFFKQGAKQ